MVEENEYKTSRDRVLQTLLAREKCTINELAEAVELNPISIRHHIVKLGSRRFGQIGRRTSWCRPAAQNLFTHRKRSRTISDPLYSVDAYGCLNN